MVKLSAKVSVLCLLGAAFASSRALEEPDRIPISQVPIILHESGSYYLTGTLSTSSGNIGGIVVQASNVTIDLNGHSLIGRGVSASGISCSTPQRNLVVRNGIIVDWGLDGISASTIDGVHIEDVQLINSRRGVYSAGPTIVEDCIARRNGESGIDVGIRSVVRGCLVEHMSDLGIRVLADSRVEDCEVYGATSVGTGITAGSNCVIERNKVIASTLGIVAGARSRVNDNVVRGEAPNSTGIKSSGGGPVTDNHVTYCQTGLHLLGARSLVTGNSFSMNGQDIIPNQSSLIGPVLRQTDFATSVHPHPNFQL